MARLLIAAALLGLAACGSSKGDLRIDPTARVLALPGVAHEVDFDDIVYSPKLRRVLVPARHSGLFLIDPESDEAERLGRVSSADSVDAGRARIFVGDRDEGAVHVLDARSGRVVASAATAATPDYVRFVGATGELWVTEPAASPSGIEIFAIGDFSAAPRRVGFVRVPNGPEGFAWSAARRMAYTHAGNDVVAIDLASRRVTARWATGCDGTHGFPRVDDRDGLLLASCADDGKVVLLNLDDGQRLGTYSVGGGEALPGYSRNANHFYVRADPGTTLATLAASHSGLKLVHEVRVPATGHCLTADTVGHYWTCDADRGRVLRFEDP